MTTFALNLAKQIEAAKAQSELVAKKTMIELFNRVIQKSPVDTGRFRANWNCSIGSPDLSTSQAIDPSGSGAISKATSTVVSYTLNGQSVFLTNNLPYADRLENGWSKQAPNGIVRLSVMEIQNSVR
jgi:hypothetical protein